MKTSETKLKLSDIEKAYTIKCQACGYLIPLCGIPKLSPHLKLVCEECMTVFEVEE